MVLALALLVVGGMALLNALTSSGSSDAGSAATSASVSPSESASRPPKQTRTPQQTAAAASTPLLIRVVGSPTQVFVRVSGSGEVLQQGTLNTGEARQYEQAPLDVVAINGASVEVTIYGRKQAPKPAGTRGEWFVPER